MAVLFRVGVAVISQLLSSCYPVGQREPAEVNGPHASHLQCDCERQLHRDERARHHGGILRVKFCFLVNSRGGRTLHD